MKHLFISLLVFILLFALLMAKLKLDAKKKALAFAQAVVDISKNNPPLPRTQEGDPVFMDSFNPMYHDVLDTCREHGILSSDQIDAFVNGSGTNIHGFAHHPNVGRGIWFETLLKTSETLLNQK